MKTLTRSSVDVRVGGGMRVYVSMDRSGGGYGQNQLYYGCAHCPMVVPTVQSSRAPLEGHRLGRVGGKVSGRPLGVMETSAHYRSSTIGAMCVGTSVPGSSVRLPCVSMVAARSRIRGRAWVCKYWNIASDFQWLTRRMVSELTLPQRSAMAPPAHRLRALMSGAMKPRPGRACAEVWRAVVRSLDDRVEHLVPR